MDSWHFQNLITMAQNDKNFLSKVHSEAQLRGIDFRVNSTIQHTKSVPKLKSYSRGKSTLKKEESLPNIHANKVSLNKRNSSVPRTSLLLKSRNSNLT